MICFRGIVIVTKMKKFGNKIKTVSIETLVELRSTLAWICRIPVRLDGALSQESPIYYNRDKGIHFLPSYVP